MIIRFGYVAMSVVIADCSPSKTITVANYQKIDGEEARLSKLRRITEENLRNSIRLLHHNWAHHIYVFRFTSRLIPLATHPLTAGWDYAADFADRFAEIGELVKKYGMRVSTHPDHFTLINSPRPEVHEASLRDLEYHEKVFQAMGLDEAEMIMHVGGLYGSRKASMDRFKEKFRELPEGIKKRLRLENDDKSFGVKDVLEICTDLKIPMVLDVHHHQCLNNGEKIADILPGVFETWGDRLPKLHFSSPKSEKNCRAHAEDIEFGPFLEFLQTAREFDRDMDIMLEAKNKDQALFNLTDQLREVDWVEFVEDAVIKL